MLTPEGFVITIFVTLTRFDSGRNTPVARNSKDAPRLRLPACHVSSESRATHVFCPLPLLFADIGHCSQAMLNVNFVFPV